MITNVNKKNRTQGSIYVLFFTVLPTGIEPVISTLKGWRLNQFVHRSAEPFIDDKIYQISGRNLVGING